MQTDITNRNISLNQIFSYFLEGAKLAFSKDIRHYIVIPILANILLIGLAVVLFFGFVSTYLSGLFLNYFDNEYIQLAAYLVSLLFSAIILFLMTYYFATIAIIIASPFYGMLAQKVELIKQGNAGTDESFSQIIKDVPRILKRELDKQLFFIPRAILCLIITIIPVINLISPLCWIFLTSYMATIQFTDYGFDNHKIAFRSMRHAIGQNKLVTLVFGFIVVFALSIPFLNLIFPVIAVCAATLYFIDMQKCGIADIYQTKRGNNFSILNKDSNFDIEKK